MSGEAAILACSPWGAKAGLSMRPGVPAIASPMWQAVEWSNWIVTSDEGPQALFLKVLEPDLAGLFDVEAAHAGAIAGAAAGVAPAVEFFSAQDQAIGFAYLAAPWRSAWLDDLQKPCVMAGAIAAKKAFRQSAPLTRLWDVFAEVEAWVARATASGTALPSDMPALLDAVREAGKAIDAAGKDLAPCHNDGQASNLLLGPEGEVWLCDFDCAGQADPIYDLAVLLNEAYAFEADWRQGIEMQDGACHDSVLNRCRIYGLADDLLWGLAGLVLSHTSPRRGLEFLKYGEWRLLRARMALRDPGFAARYKKL
jgi:hypothetical protein